MPPPPTLACPASPPAEQQWACRRCSAVGLVRQGTSPFPANARNDSPAARKRAPRREAPAPMQPPMLACHSPREAGPKFPVERAPDKVSLRPLTVMGGACPVPAQPDVIYSSAGTATGPPKRHPRGWRQLYITRRCARSSRACHAGCSPAPRAPRPGKHPSRQSLAAPPTPASGLR